MEAVACERGKKWEMEEENVGVKHVKRKTKT